MRLGAVGLVAVFALGASSVPVPTAPPARQVRPKYVPKAGDFAVICSLFMKDPPGHVNLPDIPITYDPRFLIGARVEQVTLGSSPWKVGESVRFLIHSPTLTLGGYPVDGQRYVLTFSPFRPKTEDDKVWFKPETKYLLRSIEKAPDRAGGGA
jgi:hypothetical protein